MAALCLLSEVPALYHTALCQVAIQWLSSWRCSSLVPSPILSAWRKLIADVYLQLDSDLLPPPPPLQESLPAPDTAEHGATFDFICVSIHGFGLPVNISIPAAISAVRRSQ